MADARGADPCTFIGGRDTGNSADTGKPWRRRRSKPSRRSDGDVRLFATRQAEISSGRSAEADHARSRSDAVDQPPRSSLPSASSGYQSPFAFRSSAVVVTAAPVVRAPSAAVRAVLSTLVAGRLPVD